MFKALIFQLDDQSYGLAANNVVELTRAVSITALPNAPSAVAGMINFRGTIIAVFDIRLRFGLPPKAVAVTEHLVVARAGNRTVAIRADHAVAVCDLVCEDVDAVISDLKHVAGVAKLADGLILIHDLSTFLTDSEAFQLDQLLAEHESGGERN